MAASSAVEAKTEAQEDAKVGREKGSGALTEAAEPMPTACVEAGKTPCLMPPAAAKRICAKVNPDLAVALFSKEAPWTHAYVNVQKADSFNGLGGPSSEQKLVFDEELVILGERKADMGGMTVSGAGSNYDLMRWDGTCATLSSAEVTLRRPPKPKHANIPFRSLSDSVQQALREDAKVQGFFEDRRKHCKGATMGEVTAACEKSDRSLNDRVAEAVRSGLRVPIPAKLP